MARNPFGVRRQSERDDGALAATREWAAMCTYAARGQSGGALRLPPHSKASQVLEWPATFWSAPAERKRRRRFDRDRRMGCDVHPRPSPPKRCRAALATALQRIAGARTARDFLECAGRELAATALWP